MGKKRKMPGLNTSSTADISFMLLIFFLVTTSMDTDQGLARSLPKPPEDDQLNNEIKVKERNILNIRINKDNYLLIGDDYATLADVKERAKEQKKSFLLMMASRSPILVLYGWKRKRSKNYLIKVETLMVSTLKFLIGYWS